MFGGEVGAPANENEIIQTLNDKFPQSVTTKIY